MHGYGLTSESLFRFTSNNLLDRAVYRADDDFIYPGHIIYLRNSRYVMTAENRLDLGMLRFYLPTKIQSAVPICRQGGKTQKVGLPADDFVGCGLKVTVKPAYTLSMALYFGSHELEPIDLIRSHMDEREFPAFSVCTFIRSHFKTSNPKFKILSRLSSKLLMLRTANPKR